MNTADDHSDYNADVAFESHERSYSCLSLCHKHDQIVYIRHGCEDCYILIVSCMIIPNNCTSVRHLIIADIVNAAAALDMSNKCGQLGSRSFDRLLGSRSFDRLAWQ